MQHRRGVISLSNVIFLVIIVAAIAAVMLVRGGGSADTASADTFFASTVSFQQAQQTAADEGKLVFVLATADWCPPCQALKGGTLADPGVQGRINELAVPYKLDTTDLERLSPEDKQLFDTLGVRGYPTMYLLDGDRVVASTMGAVPAGDFTNWLNAAASN